MSFYLVPRMDWHRGESLFLSPSQLDGLIIWLRGDMGISTGGARDLDGVNQSFTATDPSQVDLSTTDVIMTITVSRDDTGNQALLSKYQDANNYWRMEFNASNILHFISVVGGVTKIEVTGTTAITDTDWHTITLSIDRSATATTTFFLDGTDDTAGTPTVSVDDADNTGDFWIGQSDGRYFNGQFSYAGVGKDTLLTAADEVEHFNFGQGSSLGSLTAALQAKWTIYYNGNEASGNLLDGVGSVDLTATNAPGADTGPAAETTPDVSGNGNTGMLTNFATPETSYGTDVAHGTFEPSAADGSSNTNPGALAGYGLKTAWDKSGNGNHGTLTNYSDGFAARTTSIATGATGVGLQGDGASERVVFSALSASLSSSWSITTWLRLDEHAAVDNGFFLSMTSTDWSNDSDTQLLFDTSAKLRIRSGNLSTGAPLSDVHKESADALTLGVWTHVAVIWNGVAFKAYYDGVETVVSDGSNELGIGWALGGMLLTNFPHPTNGWTFKGAMDSFKIWTSALTAVQVVHDFEDHTGTPSVPGDDPGDPDALWLDFEDDPRDATDVKKVVPDDSSNSNVGHIIGMPSLSSNVPTVAADTSPNAIHFGQLRFQGTNPLSHNVPRIAPDAGSGDNDGKLVGFDVADPTTSSVPEVFPDDTNNGNIGLIRGGVGAGSLTKQIPSGATGNAVLMDGVDDYIDLTHALSDRASDTVGTWSIWMRPNDGTPSNYRMLVVVGDSGTEEMISLWVNTGGHIKGLAQDGSLGASTKQWEFTSDSVVTASDTWHHVVLVQNGTVPILYIDGEIEPITFDVTTDQTFWLSDLSNLSNYRVGVQEFGGDPKQWFWEGTLDDFRHFDSALSASNVKFLYEDFTGTSAETDPGSGDLQIHLPFDSKDIALGTGVTFDGVDDVIKFDPGGCESDTAGTVAFWMRPAAGTASSVQCIFSAGDDGSTGDYLEIYALNSDITYSFRNDGGTTDDISTTSDNAPVEQWTHVAVVSSGTAITIYLNGVSQALTVGSGANSGNWFGDITTPGLDVGAIGALVRSTTQEYFEGDIDDVRVYSDALTAAEVHFLLADHPSTGPAADDPGTANLVGHWDLEIDAATGKSFLFDGTDDQVIVRDHADIQDIFATGGTVMCWINVASDGESNGGRIIAKVTDPSSGWTLQVADEASGKVKVEFYQIFSGDDGNWATTSTEVFLNQWTHVAVTYDASDVANNAIIYINGVAVAITEVTTPVGTFASDVGDDLTIGNRSDGALTFDGLIDDPRIYNLELAAQQILALAQDFTGAPDVGGDLPGVLNLVTLHTFDELTPATGKSIEFDGTDDYLAFDPSGFESDTAGAVVFWMKPSGSGTQCVFSAADNDATSDYLEIYALNDDVTYSWRNDGGTTDDISTTSDNAPADTWTHVAVVSTGTSILIYINGISESLTVGSGANSGNWFGDITTPGLVVGTIGALVRSTIAEYFADNIHGVRVFSAALTAAQVKYLFENTFSFAETAGDDPGETNLVGRWITDSALTAVSGNALRFDGASNYVVVPDTAALDFGASTDFSVSAWIRFQGSTSASSHIVTKHSSGAVAGWHIVVNDPDGRLGVSLRDASTIILTTDDGPIIADQSWHHIAVTFDRDGDLTRYVDGVQSGTADDISSVGNIDNAYDLLIGQRHDIQAGTYFNGLVDDVEIYNDILTANEVKFLHERGLAGGGTDPTDDNLVVSMGFDEDNFRDVATLQGGLSLDFDGSDDYVDAGNIGSGIKTISFWLKPDDITTRKLIDIDGTDQIELDGSGNVTATSFPGTTKIYVNGVETAEPLVVDRWSHVAVTDTTGVTGSTFEIGRAGSSNEFDGSMDDVRAYTALKTAGEVWSLYTGADDQTGAAGIWPLDVGPLAGGVDGDLVTSWTDQSSAGTYYSQVTVAQRPSLRKDSNGLNGREALEFDGTADNLQGPAGTNLPDLRDFTIVLETGSSAFSGDQVPFSIGDSADLTHFYLPVIIDSDGKVNVSINVNNTGLNRVRCETTVLEVSTVYKIRTKQEGGLWVVEINDQVQTLVTETDNGEIGQVTVTASATTTITIGALVTSAGVANHFEGKIGEISGHDIDLAVTSQDGNDAYYNRRYNLT